MAKKRKNSRAKGKRAEREACIFLRALGFTANRTAQNRGKTGECGDIEVKELPHVHFEIKHRRGIDLGTKELSDAIKQASREAGVNKDPVVLWKRNGVCWRMTAPIVDVKTRAVFWMTTTDPQDIQMHLLARATEIDTKGAQEG